jgi:hypothetical protein
MAQFNYTKFLKEGGIEKYLMEADFGNDPQDRYDYIRPLMSRLPDTARTEYLIDALDQALADFNMTDDMKEKTEFDMIFIEIMKELGLESELMEAGDSLINPEAEEIDAEDLEASADYFDSLAENDDVLDEIVAEGDIQVDDLVYFKGHEDKVPMKVLKVRRMFGSNLDAITTEKGEYDEKQLVKIMSPEEKANVFVREEVDGEVQSEEVTTKIGAVQKGNVLDAIKLLNHIQYEMADEFTDESMESLSDVIVMLGQVLKTFKK